MIPSICSILMLVTFMASASLVSSEMVPEELPSQFEFFNWTHSQVIPSDYNNLQAPIINGQPVDVEVSLAILAFHRISEIDQSFKIDVFLHMKWKDFRMHLPRGIPHTHKLTMDHTWLNKLWVPSLNFRNARSSNIVNSINPAVYLTLTNHSEILLAAKLSLDVNCDMNFYKYPFDSQACKIEISSLSNTVESINLKWGRFHLTRNLYLPQFAVDRNSTTETCVHKYDIGEFGCLKAHFKLIRNVGNFLLSKYIPSFLIVCLAFTGFWIPTTAYPARVGLCITALLSLITQQYQSALNVSYVYALNVWMMICIFFVFACLIQYSYAISDWSDWVAISRGKYSLPKQMEMKNMKSPPGSNSSGLNENKIRKSSKEDLEGGVPQDPMDVPNTRYKKNFFKMLQPNARNNSVDMLSRLLFPLSYFTITAIYFIVYMC